MPSFIIPTPRQAPWRLVLIPTTGAEMGDEIILTPRNAPFGVLVEQLPDNRLKVSLTAQKAAKIKSGRWSAVLTAGTMGEIAAVYRDIITIAGRREQHRYSDTLDLLKAFTATMPKIELSTLNNRKAPRSS